MKNIHWHQGKITFEDKEKLLKQKSLVIWLTGLSGSGKSTIACSLEEYLLHKGKLTYILDGDNIRHGLNKGLGFSPEDRKENIRRIAEVAKLFQDAGIIVITAFISPYREDRDIARSILPDGRFWEVFVDAPLSVCEERDPKNLYKKARKGEIPEFTGISAPYEAPESPEIILKTDELDIRGSTEKIVSKLEEEDMI